MLNVFLMVFVLISILGSIVISNYILSQDYSFRTLKKELNEAHAAIDSQQKIVTEDSTIESLLSFAQHSGMIETKEASSLFQDTGFALSESRSDIRE